MVEQLLFRTYTRYKPIHIQFHLYLYAMGQLVLPAAEGLARGFWPERAAWQRVSKTHNSVLIVIIIIIIINLIQSLSLSDPLIDSPSARSTLRPTNIKMRLRAGSGNVTQLVYCSICTGPIRV